MNLSLNICHIAVIDFAVCAVAPWLLEIANTVFLCQLAVQKKVPLSSEHKDLNSQFQRKILGWLLTLAAHCTPILMSCNGTWWKHGNSYHIRSVFSEN
jgi:hypothetical protein